MNINIKFEGKITEDDSFQLNQLAESIKRECLVSVQVNREEPQPGAKDIGFLIGLAIDLAAVSISIFISLLTYWQSQHSQYSVSLTRGDVTYKIENVPPDQVQNVISMLEAQDGSNIEVVISQPEENQ